MIAFFIICGISVAVVLLAYASNGWKSFGIEEDTSNEDGEKLWKK